MNRQTDTDTDIGTVTDMDTDTDTVAVDRCYGLPDSEAPAPQSQDDAHEHSCGVVDHRCKLWHSKQRAT